MPHIGQWWDVVSDTVRATFMSLLRDLEPSIPVLIMATCEVTHGHLADEVLNY